MTEAGEKWIAEVHRKRGFPRTPAWPDQAEHYIKAFCHSVESMASGQVCTDTRCASKDHTCCHCLSDAFDELKKELLG